MAGSHRAKRKAEPVARSRRPSRKKAQPRLSRRAWVIAVVVALLPALWLGAQRLLDDDDPTRRTGSTPIPDVTSTRSPSVVPTTPGTSPPPSAPATTAATLPRVPASGPRRLTVRSLDAGFDDSIETSAGGFTAASTAEAARWGSRGSPASPGTDTVFLIGKVYTAGTSAFTGLGAVRTGDVITVRTQAQDVLRYTVRGTTTRAAAGLLQNPEFTERKPGRLVLVGILYDGSDDARTGNYLVVDAQLTGAVRG